MTNDAEARLLHPSAQNGYHVRVSEFEGAHGVYAPSGALVAVFADLDSAVRRARWLNNWKPKKR